MEPTVEGALRSMRVSGDEDKGREALSRMVQDVLPDIAPNVSPDRLVYIATEVAEAIIMATRAADEGAEGGRGTRLTLTCVESRSVAS